MTIPMKQKLRQAYIKSAAYVKHVHNAMNECVEAISGDDMQANMLLDYTTTRDSITQQTGKKNQVQHLSLALEYYAHAGMDMTYSDSYLNGMRPFNATQVVIL